MEIRLGKRRGLRNEKRLPRRSCLSQSTMMQTWLKQVKTPKVSVLLPINFLSTHCIVAPAKRPKFGKNPAVDTSFLPDREREEEERREREELRKEWLRKQEEMKKEDIEITYSYWDGSGHRKSVMVRVSSLYCNTWLIPSVHGCADTQCKKGDDIATFLERCRQQFPELRGVSVDNLMYIKVCSLLYTPSVLRLSLIIRRI